MINFEERFRAQLKTWRAEGTTINGAKAMMAYSMMVQWEPGHPHFPTREAVTDRLAEVFAFIDESWVDG